MENPHGLVAWSQQPSNIGALSRNHDFFLLRAEFCLRSIAELLTLLIIWLYILTQRVLTLFSPVPHLPKERITDLVTTGNNKFTTNAVKRLQLIRELRFQHKNLGGGNKIEPVTICPSAPPPCPRCMQNTFTPSQLSQPISASTLRLKSYLNIF